MKILYRVSLAILAFICSLSALGQSKSALNLLVAQINDRHKQLPVEKLYLQTDKNYYIQNDTLWFKAYLLNGDDLTPSTISGILYVELDNSNNQCIKRIMVPLVDGISWGNIALNEDEVTEGGYTLRAYTNWMRNFGMDNVFEKQIYVASTGARSRIIATDFKVGTQADKDEIQAGLLFNNIDGQPLILQSMQLRVTDGRHILSKINTTTGVDGKLNFSFALPKGVTTKAISIIAKDVTKERDLPPYIIPITLNRSKNIDLQFMPEGGQLVAGIPAHIGFKAIGEDGKGTGVSGTVYNSKQQQVATFKSAHKGMGAFELLPQAGETYSARVILSDGNTKSYALPLVNASGVGLRVVNDEQADSVRVSVHVTHDLLSAPALPNYYLISLARNVALYGTHFTVKDEKTIISISKNALPSGITHFTLLNSAKQPLAERLAYINHNDNLRINIVPNKTQYAPHDSIALNIQVTNSAGKPVWGSFSMAVTDDGQVKTDSTASNIVNNLLLTSDLKGTVEDPAYYFANNDAQRKTELDNLLLTQGWVGYNWKQILGPPAKPEFTAEHEFTVTGRITNLFNKPVPGFGITLLSKKPAFVMDTITGKDGRFTFKGFLPVDTASFFIQAKNKRGKNAAVGIEVDEFKPPVFTQTGYRMVPWYVNSDTLLLHNLNAHITKQRDDAKLQGLGHILTEVKVTGKKIIKNSKNLNGDGGADVTLDEQDILKAGKMNLEELLMSKIKGFHQGYLRHTVIPSYMMDDEFVNFVFDGVYLNRFYTPTPQIDGLYQYIRGYLTYYTAEDIIGVEVMYNPRYSAEYVGTFLSPMLIGEPIAFIEVTTRSGHGPFMSHTPGTYLYKPMAATLPKQFYRPRYTIKGAVAATDLRSTIHWEPNIVTDTTGRATVSFYSADKRSTYSIMIEGTDLNGSLGFKRAKLIVK